MHVLPFPRVHAHLLHSVFVHHCDLIWHWSSGIGIHAPVVLRMHIIGLHRRIHHGVSMLCLIGLHLIGG